MQEIDLNNWKRKKHFAYFYKMDYPHFNVCFTIDITNFISVIKKENLPFYYTLVYLSTMSANSIEEFRYRVRDGKIILHETVHPVITDMDDGCDLFKMIKVEMKDDVKSFITHASEQSKKQREYFIASDFIDIDHDDFIRYTSLPWISFTHVSHTININKNDSVPRIAWGKYFEENTKILLPYSVQVNHAFVDGIHIGKFREELEKNINNFTGL
jgi:chloramphenicol O-acetyltransferase type A